MTHTNTDTNPLDTVLKKHKATKEIRITLQSTNDDAIQELRQELYEHFEMVQHYSTPFNTTFICQN